MKNLYLIILLPIFAFAQENNKYNVSAENPYGKLNPNAPKEVADYEKLIGTCDCLSSRIQSDGTWAEAQKMTWTFKYIMNGYAVQDESFKEDGIQNGSIRQFVADSTKWYVHWYTSGTPTAELSVWSGNKKGDNIVVYMEQKAPNGMDGFSRLTYKNITKEGFNWIGEWVDVSENIQFPFWKIDCIKRKRNN